MLPVGTVVGDRFVLEAEIAAGGMGTIFRARERETSKPVAVKLLRDLDVVSLVRFDRECTTLGQLSHPNIVKYVAHGADPVPFLVMEWIEGSTLAAKLEREGLDLAASIDIAQRLAGALAHAHAASIVHRDLKPSNVVLRDDDLAGATLIDFGVSRVAAPVVPLVTRNGTTVGTPGYMGPEQARGVADLDGRADVFALGCLLYECLTGTRAFDGTNPMAIQVKICMLDPPRASERCPELPPDLERLLDAMLMKQRAARPTAAEVEATLRAIDRSRLPPGPRRPLGDEPESVSTRVAANDAGSQLRCTVLCTPVDPPAADDKPPTISDLGVDVVVLHDGTLVSELHGDDPHTAIRAATLALALAERLAGYAVVVTCSDLGGDDTIERASNLLTTVALEALFAPVVAAAAPGVRIDRSMARRVAPAFLIRSTPDGGVLQGPR